ncbi:type II secretion system F family protein [Cellulomonas sp. S1-8]|uniref:type II secretion system F family protein n=1 Tax=Cellulomonas sp. S1-8 TaxID=2904790 RepID=UPI002244167E|nr:type II secretion system F family protein [Cellulomonas sp. S1-8]UZN02159.1 type II secretion system F family protein [Cellulomonas sp. S1-8]
MIVVGILVLVFAAAVLLVVGTSDIASVSSRRRAILAGAVDEPTATWQHRVAAWDRVFVQTRLGAWVQRQLLLAGEEGRSPVLVVTLAALGGAVLGWVLAVGLAPVFGLAGIAGGIVGIRAWLSRAQDRRNEAFVAQMPELARVLSNATGAGLSIASAVTLAADELSAPAGVELGRVAARLRFGASLDVAMREMEERLPSREVSVLVSTLLVSARSGGSLVSALRDIADTLDERKEIRREVRTTLAQASVTGYIVIGMGVGILFLLNFVQPGTVQAMTDHWVGRGALIFAGALYTAGFLTIRRMTRVDA